MLAILLVYSLMAARVMVRMSAGVSGIGGCAAIEAGIPGIWIRRDYVLVIQDKAPFLRGIKRYFKRKKRMPPEKRKRLIKKLKPYILPCLKACRMENLEIRARLGLEEAWQTAMVGGAANALASALRLKAGENCHIHIVSDFSAAGASAVARCIFSFCAGDIMFAALKTALKRSGREGFGWKSIPLRA